MIHAMDDYADERDEKVVIQTGMGATKPRHAEHFDFKPREEVLQYQSEARVIVCHAGIGSVIDALQCAKPIVVVPRLKRFSEHNNDHQLDLAEAVERRGWGRVIEDIAELSSACDEPPPAYENYRPAKDSLIDAVRSFINEKGRCG